MFESQGTLALESFTRPFWKRLTVGVAPAAPTVTVPVFSTVMIWSSTLRFITAMDVCCMIWRWLPWLAKMLKPVLRTRSCHSCSVTVFWRCRRCAPG
jgi:hypothetical protein